MGPGEKPTINRHRRLLFNTVANMVGQLLPTVLALVMVPVYIAYLGMEPYGLIGFFSSLIILLHVFSQGITHALQREYARRDVSDEGRPTMRRLTRTFERIYMGIGLMLGLILALNAGHLSRAWVRMEHLDPRTVEWTILWLSLRIGMAFPQGVYQSVFIGTQRQVEGNVLTVICSLCGMALNLAIVVWTGSIVWLYAGECVYSVIYVSVLRYRAFRILPAEHDQAEVFSRADVQAIARPSAGIMWTSGIGIIIAQLDRIALSRLTGLAQLAVYNASIAGGRLLNMVYMPFLMAAYPETCQMFSRADRAALTRHLIRNATVVSILTASVTLPASFFGEDLLLEWTRQTMISEQGGRIMAIYMLGSLLLSQASVFYMLQMASGSVFFVAVFNTTALLWYPLMMYQLVRGLGAEGCAWAWLAYGLFSWLFLMVLSFRRNLERKEWLRYLQRFLVPVMWAWGVAAAARWLAMHVLPNMSLLRVAWAGLTVLGLLPSSFVLCLGGAESRKVLGKVLPFFNVSRELPPNDVNA
jgi:O-antigen/teichoic acid export membrane protein